MARTIEVEVRQTVEVQLDESKFTEQFMAEFRREFYDYATIEQHARHLATLYTFGMVSDFIEGYGDPADFGIKFREQDTDSEVMANTETVAT